MQNWFSKLLAGILVIGVSIGSTGLESKASSCNSFKPYKNIISVNGIKYKLPSDSYGSGTEPEYEYYDGKGYYQICFDKGSDFFNSIEGKKKSDKLGKYKDTKLGRAYYSKGNTVYCLSESGTKKKAVCLVKRIVKGASHKAIK